MAKITGEKILALTGEFAGTDPREDGPIERGEFSASGATSVGTHTRRGGYELRSSERLSVNPQGRRGSTPQRTSAEATTLFMGPTHRTMMGSCKKLV